MYRKPLDTDTCPSTSDLESYAAHRLIGRRNEEIFLHLKHCGKCLRRMAELTRTPSPKAIIEGAARPGLWQRVKALWPFRRR